MFKKVNPRQNFPEMEKEIMNNWKENQTFERSVENREDEKTYSFFDGPPFATGLPHYGHVVASLIKDVVPRFQTMKGKKVNRRWGWDCHGLPVENLVEKEHGIKNKQDIEKWGVENFNDACHNSVLRYAEDWKKFIPRIGRWVDMENDYRTMDWKYTESIWWVFSELFKKGLVYEGHKAMHICPRCETTLSNFEVTQGYKDITDLSATVKFKLKKASVKVLRQKILNQVQDDSAVQDEEVFVLAWTTTPWTLPGNVALAVGFSIKYLVFSIKGKSGKFILAKDQAEEILKDEEFEILNEIDGKDLVGLEYYPLFGYMKKLLEMGKDVPYTPRPKKKPKPKPTPAAPTAEATPAAETKPEDKPMDVSMQDASQTEVAVDARKFPFSYYLSAIERRVSENWLSAQGGRDGGVAFVVYFRLSRNGRVSDLRVETPSGNAHFDRSALRAIRSADPFPPLPRAFGESWLGIHFTFTQKK